MKKKIVSLMMAAMMVVGTLGTTGLQVNAAEEKPTITASLSDGKTVNLLSGDIYEFVSDYDWTANASDDYVEEDGNYKDNYAPDDVTLTWTAEDGAEYYAVKIGTDKELKNAQNYVTYQNSLTFSNLYIGTHYYYQVTAVYADKTVKSRIFDFVTSAYPRTMAIDKVSNTRDMGGYLTVDGKHRIRQGMVYRGAKLDDISELGKRQLLQNYGVKFDLDLRSGTEGMSVSPLGSSVGYTKVSGPYYIGDNGIEKEQYKDALIEEIRTFAQAENYPIYVHCSQGKDRTGTICFLISGLLGASKSDLYLDYELSYFSIPGKESGTTPGYFIASFTKLYDYMASYGEGSLAENIEKFMKDLGITDREIQAIKDNMLEDVNAQQKAPVSYEVTATTDTKTTENTPVAPSGDEFDCSYRYSAAIGSLAYGSTDATRMSADEAQQAGVPNGYAGDVVKVVGNPGAGIGLFLNFADKKIAADDVDSITFRLYIDGDASGSYPEVRIPRPVEGGGWVVRYNASSKAKQWFDMTFVHRGNGGDSNFLVNEGTMDYADISKDGYLHEFGFMVRLQNLTTFYIDSVKVNMKGSAPVVDATDKTAPVIADIAEEISAVKGTIPQFNVKVTDNAKTAPSVSYLWSEGAYDGYGTLLTGTHTCMIVAEDLGGNVATKTIKVNVTDSEEYKNVTDEEEKFGCKDPCAKAHDAVKTNAVSATCTKDGNITYWTCKNCNKIFKDSACKTEITKAQTVVKKTGHKNLTKTSAVAATCTKAGNIAYWTCKGCGKIFKDSACKNEITKAQTVVNATGHKKLTKVSAVAATYAKTGMKAHYRCACGKLFLDKSAKKSVTKSQLTVKKLTVAKPSVKKVTAKSKALAISWTKKSGVTGYQIQVAVDKKFKKSLKTTTIKGASKSSVTVKKLKAKKTYYVRVRAYKKVSGKTYVSSWSKVTSKKTKK